MIYTKPWYLVNHCLKFWSTSCLIKFFLVHEHSLSLEHLHPTNQINKAKPLQLTLNQIFFYLNHAFQPIQIPLIYQAYLLLKQHQIFLSESYRLLILEVFNVLHVEIFGLIGCEYFYVQKVWREFWFEEGGFGWWEVLGELVKLVVDWLGLQLV